MTLAELIRQAQKAVEEARSARATAHERLTTLRDDPRLTEDAAIAAIKARDEADATLREREERLTMLQGEQRADDEIARLQRESHPTGATLPGGERELHPGQMGGSSSAGTRGGFVRLADGRPAGVARGQRFIDHPAVAEHAAARARADEAIMGAHGSLGNQLRAMTTTSGSAVVPTVWLGDIIDRARNLSAIFRAGAELVPMDAKTVQIGRLTTDPTAAFRAEGSPVAASDPVFDNVTLDAKTMSALVVGSLEWFQDAPNVDEVVQNAIAKAIALHLDLITLFGGLTTGTEGFNLPTPPNPRGVLATLLAVAAGNVLGSDTNGTAQTPATYWREVQQAAFKPQEANEMPNALLWNSRLAQQYTDAYDTTNQPLSMPANTAAMARFTTNQIPSFTQGTMTDVATDLFVGDWAQLLIGQRLDLTVQTLTERYAENGQVGIIAHWRGDVALARPLAFAVYRYLLGA